MALFVHLMRVNSDWYTKGSGKTEISQLDHSFAIYEKILRFQISVKNTSLVAE